MYFEGTKMLEFNQYSKCNKMPYIFYEDLESLIRKIGGCVNNPEKAIYNNIISHVGIQFLKYRHLIVYEISAIYKEAKIS